VAERMIGVNGVELCTESFGDPSDPAVLLVMGVIASKLWWEEGFCRLLAARGSFVIRYDHRGTSRSVTYEPGRPQYTGADLVGDAVGVLDVYGIAASHVVGVSAGGAFAQLLAMAQENVVVVRFSDPSKAYQALSVLKDCNADGRIGLESAAIVERQAAPTPTAAARSSGRSTRGRTPKPAASTA
jgi:pimeloyl-ACP methyl ester carboxylesterase